MDNINREKHGMIELEVSYSGLHKFFSDIYKKGVVEVDMALENLTIEEAELINMVGSEYFYIILEMRTVGNITEIFMLNELY